MTILSRREGHARARQRWLHTFSAAPALALVMVIGCAGPPRSVEAPSTTVIPPPVSASPAPSAGPAVDRSTCRPHPPAMRFEVENDDAVVPLDARGCPLGESHFKPNGFSYQASVDFVTDLQRRLRVGDKAGLAALVNYPLHFSRGKGTTSLIKDHATFIRSYDHVYSPEVIRAILAADPRDLFCNSHGIMIGNGILRADRTAKGHYGLIAANAP